MNDLRHAARSLLKSPGFTAIAILTLALGIGLNTSMFSLMDFLILRPLPFPERDQLVRIYRTTPQSQTAEHYYPDFVDLRPEVASFADLAAFRFWNYALAVNGRPAVNLNGYRLSANFLGTLGVTPALGRFFTPDEDRPGNHVMILGYATWQSQFGGDPAVIGRQVTLDNESTTIIGVAPASLASTVLLQPGDVFRPLALTDAEKRDYGSSETRLVARLHAGTTLEQFDARLHTIATQLGPQRPKEHAKDGLRAVTLQSSTHSAAVTGATAMLLALSGFVLLIACANLANLQLARAIARTHEHAIRAALGASRSRLLRQPLAESLLLAVGGGVFGILLATWTNDWLSAQLMANGGLANFHLTLAWPVLAFALGLTLLTGVVFGLAPAWFISRTRVNETLKVGSRGSTGDRAQHRLRHSLIVLQFANALILLAGAGFVIAGVNQLLSFDPGWNQHALTECVLTLPQAKYSTPQQSYSFYSRLEERLSTLPGVQSVTVGWTLPLFGYLTNRGIVVEGRERPEPGHEPSAAVNGVEPSYLDSLQIKLLAGRNFTADDTYTSPPVVIINASLARALFPQGDALGQHINVSDPAKPSWAEVVGIMPDIKMALAGLVGPSPFQVYRPLAQEPWNYVTVAVRSENPAAQVEPMRLAIATLDPNLAVQQLDTVDHAIAQATGGLSLIRTVLVGFAGLGLFLAALGLYGVIARLVMQRTPEIGIRMALGAQARDVAWLILGTGLRLIAVGAAVGLVGALGIYLLYRHVLPATAINVPAVFAIITTILLVVGLVACWLPARRAAKVDPLVALRAE
ncbi:MAG TPA: ABC transporter permease [Lacunisphaera sp.]|jgi:predicted permease|nr:ABC transporter permease [Lacunisphaera sp.]